MASNTEHPYELVRVRDRNVERTTTRAAASKAGLTVLDKEATDPRDGGKPLAPLRVTDKAGKPATTKEA